MASTKASKRRSRRRDNEERTGAELVTLAISIVLLVLLVGGIVWLDVTSGDAHPRIDVEPHFDQAYQHHGDWYLPVDITNVGDRATDQLQVDLVRPVEGEEPEVATLEYTFVAGGERVSGYAVFDEEPTEEAIEVDVLAITEP